ncbi:MAG: hypothetical protein AMXMBFR34_32970 [Myxococcaceae bacterium]
MAAVDARVHALGTQLPHHHLGVRSDAGAPPVEVGVDDEHGTPALSAVAPGRILPMTDGQQEDPPPVVGFGARPESAPFRPQLTSFTLWSAP